MKSLKFLLKPKKLRQPIIVRRVVGESMFPALQTNKIIIARGWFNSLKAGDIVVIKHAGLDKIKRVQEVKDDKVYVVGDNKDLSTDSRSFGWIDRAQIIGKKL